MNEKFELRGYWFLPNKYETKVAGILSFIPNEKIELELIGALENQDEPLMNFFNAESVNVIYGITSDNKEVTLFFCNPFGSLNFSCPFPITKYTCQYLLVGKYLSDFKEPSFNCMEVHLPILSEWLYPGLIETQIESKAGKQRRFSYSVSNDKTEKPKFETQIDRNFNLVLRSGVSNSEDDLRLKVELSQKTYFEVESIQDKAKIDDLLQKSYMFEQFISLASLKTNRVSSIILFDNDNYQELESGKKSIHPIEFYHVDRTPFLSKEKSNKDFLFTYSQIESIFPKVIYNWYNDSENNAPIRTHLIESIKEKSQYSNFDFLIVVQALEGFHRRYVNQKKMPLKIRLSELKKQFDDISRINNINIDFDAAVESRDYYSHFFDKKEKPHLLDGLELFMLSKKLRLLLICCVLYLIGVENNFINDILNNSNSDKLI